MNNSVYYHLFDSIVNTYLINHCGLVPTESPLIGLVVSSFCNFFSPISFPDVVDLGLRITKLGTSSVSYEVGVFKEGSEHSSAVGGYTHVFVDSGTRKSTPVTGKLHEGLHNLYKSSKHEHEHSSAKL